MSDGSADAVSRETIIRVEDGELVINDEVAITAYLHDPQDEPTPLAEAESIKIQHPADGWIDGQPCGIYSLEGRPDDRPCVTIQLDRFKGENDE